MRRCENPFTCDFLPIGQSVIRRPEPVDNFSKVIFELVVLVNF